MAATKTGSKTISPIGMAFLGVGTLIEGQGKYNALQAQGRAEEQNAEFYVTQAEFAQASGDRKMQLYEDESQIIYGEQASAFAKAGLDTENTSFFMASQMLKRQTGYEAIKTDTEMNVYLAKARAQAAHQASGEYGAAAENERMGTFIQVAATAALL